MSDAKSAAGSTGVSMGCALAIVLSYGKWHSILWAVLHGFCSWFCVVYFWLRFA